LGGSNNAIRQLIERMTSRNHGDDDRRAEDRPAVVVAAERKEKGEGTVMVVKEGMTRCGLFFEGMCGVRIVVGEGGKLSVKGARTDGCGDLGFYVVFDVRRRCTDFEICGRVERAGWICVCFARTSLTEWALVVVSIVGAGRARMKTPIHRIPLPPTKRMAQYVDSDSHPRKLQKKN
jgi:hypothetical protein